jgi:hypothetical protein
MMPFKDSLGQVIKLLVTILALIPLAVRLSIMKPTLVDKGTFTMGTANTVWPAQLSDLLVAFSIIYQILNCKHYFIPKDIVIAQA